VGCPLCDALNRRAPQAAQGLCWQCASPLPAGALTDLVATRARLQVAVALLLTAWVCIVLVHALPMVALELQGRHSAVSLLSAVQVLWSQGRLALASAILLTTVLAPALEMAAMLAAVLALTAQAREVAPPVPRWLRPALHLWQGTREWNMTEVLVLGTAVALVKLGELATLIIGPGLVALMVFMALRLAALRQLSPAQAWSLIAPQAAERRA
jgi:paraquat-inducible protein A